MLLTLPRTLKRQQAYDREKRYQEKHPDRVKANRVRYQQRYPEMQRIRQFAGYGLTIDQHNALLEAQNEKCAICAKVVTPLGACIDHDHETGKVRGLLCKQCNHGLGLFYDKPDALRKAAAYLEKHAV